MPRLGESSVRAPANAAAIYYPRGGPFIASCAFLRDTNWTQKRGSRARSRKRRFYGPKIMRPIPSALAFRLIVQPDIGGGKRGCG